MPTWYVRVTTFEHYRIEAETAELAGEAGVTRVAHLANISDKHPPYPDFVQTEILGFDVSMTDAEGDPIGEAAVAGGDYPPQDITGAPAAAEEDA